MEAVAAEVSLAEALVAAALAEAVQAQVGDTLSNDTQKTANGTFYAIRCFFVIPNRQLGYRIHIPTGRLNLYFARKSPTLIV